ncbi:MAG: hypothetical protein ACTHKJ_10295 [Candidatus Nitrosocosmicus sp.]
MTSIIALATIQQEHKDFDMSTELHSYSLFINAIRAGQTRSKYQAGLETFFDHISISNTNLKEKGRILVKLANPFDSYFFIISIFFNIF